MRRSPRPATLAALAALALGAALAAAPSLPSTGAGEDVTEAAGEQLAAVLALEGDAGRGADSYASCAVCHGPDGSGRPDGTFPRIAGQHPEVLAKQLVDVRAGLRRNPVMKPHAEALLDEQQVADVVTYVAALPASGAPGRGPGRDLPRGERLYRRDCVRCHGLDGEGDGPGFVPRLGGQHFAYLTRQIRAIAAGRRGNAHGEMTLQVRAYSDPELQAVVDYAGRLPGR